MDCEFQSRKTKQLLHPTFYIFFLTPCMSEEPPPGTKLKGKDDQKDSKHTGKLFVMLLFNIIPLKNRMFRKNIGLLRLLCRFQPIFPKSFLLSTHNI